MEHLVLGLVLLARTQATTNPLQRRDLEPTKEMRLDMASTTFDNQYRGCSCMMEEELGDLSCTEFTNNIVYAKYWTQAAPNGGMGGVHVPQMLALQREHLVALLAYTLPGALYHEFNGAMHETGSSCREYLDKFHFKVLHFLMTQALSTVRNTQPSRCHHIYWGVRGIRITAQHQDLLHFNQFTSTSLRNKSALDFDKDTFFSVYTCYSVPIRDFSFYPDEDEVLILPYEDFDLTNITEHGDRACIQLHFRDTFSKYNCKWVKGHTPP
ncbi:erythroblast NAD(P)(+)--arginine ADP-ribosyltransferase-like [Numenius arquata]|uniref:erythroblast NAD(P)(+)--arginine ADP-ribosyltransferase-like n=1 Tax=Numenius arquata TaxID=31919 RepID=UPI003D308ECE